MGKKYPGGCIAIVLLTTCSLYGAAGRPADGFLSFIVILGFLGVILGMLHLIDYLRHLIRRLLERNGEEMLP
jgi:hypothetical protein